MFPYFPGFALVCALICMGSMLYSNPLVAVLFAGLLFSGYIYFHITRRQRAVAPLDTLLESNHELESGHGIE